MKKLTQKQEKFCLKYFECGNATEAYRAAYSTSRLKDKTVWEYASRLASNSKVIARVNELRAKAEAQSIWTVDKLIKAHTEIYELGVGKKSSPHIVTEGAGEGITQTIEVDMKDTNLAGAKASLVEIGKLLGFYTNNVKIEGELSLKDFAKKLYQEQQDD